MLALYYYEELNLRQVGEVLHVSESRVSQIRSQALRRLKAELGCREGGTDEPAATVENKGAAAMSFGPISVSLLPCLFVIYTRIRVQSAFALPNFLLHLPLISCAFPFTCSPVPQWRPRPHCGPAFNLLRRALEPVLGPFGRHVFLVSHVHPRNGFGVSDEVEHRPDGQGRAVTTVTAAHADAGLGRPGGALGVVTGRQRPPALGAAVAPRCGTARS